MPLTQPELTALLAPLRAELDRLASAADQRSDFGRGWVAALASAHVELDRLNPSAARVEYERLRDRSDAFLAIDKALADAGAYAAIPKGVSYTAETLAQVIVAQRDAALRLLKELQESDEIGVFPKSVDSIPSVFNWWNKRADALLAAACPEVKRD